jgi:hypothetical protein
VALGVIEAVKPVLWKLLEVVVTIDVEVDSTTCNTLPAGNTAPLDKSRLDPDATSIT